MGKSKFTYFVLALVLIIVSTASLCGYFVYKKFIAQENFIVESRALFVGEEISSLNVGKLDTIKVTKQDGNVLSLDVNTNVIKANNVGSATVEVYKPFSNDVRRIEINVYNQGTGTSEDPFNILYKENLMSITAKDSDGKFYALRQDIDLTGEKWTPLGTNSEPFMASFDGNGFTIKNINIVPDVKDFDLDKDNLNNRLYIGFFGLVKGKKLEDETIVKTTIKNLNLDNIVIDTLQKDNENSFEKSLYNGYHTEMIHVGALAGRMQYVDVIGTNSYVTSVITSDLVNDVDSGMFASSVSGFIGQFLDSKLEGYNVDTKIIATEKAFVNDEKNYGANIAGVIGACNRSEIKDVHVKASLNTNYFANYIDGSDTIPNGVTGFVFNIQNTDVTNCSVDSININYGYYGSLAYHYGKAGPVASAFVNITNAKIDSFIVTDATIYGVNTIASGFCYNNNGTIIDSKVANAVIDSEYNATGFVVYNEGIIKYTDAKEEESVVCVTLNIKNSGFGFACKNVNSGSISAENGTAYIKNTINFVGDSTNNSFISCGLIGTNSGYVSNIKVESVLNKNVNISSLFNVVTGGTISNITASSTVYTFGMDKETKDVAGIALSITGANISKINLIQNVNSLGNKNTIETYSAISKEGTAVLSEVNVNVAVYSNNLTSANIKKSPETITGYTAKGKVVYNNGEDVITWS